MRSVLIYSSLTGNTKKVAEAIFEIMPPGSEMAPIKKAPPAEDYDCLVLGFWVNRAKPDPLTWQYMERIKGKTVAAFGTMAAYPNSAHAGKVVENTKNQLNGNHWLGCFLCQGRLAPKRMEARLNGACADSKHLLTPQRLARLIEAEKHPDSDDLKAAQIAFKAYLSRLIPPFDQS